MASIRLALLALLALAPALASARAWKGITPGTSTQAQVIERFGEPTKKTTRGGRTILAYFGEQALEGTRQAQFHLDAQGVVAEITVFLSVQLDADSIEGTYGKPTKRAFSEDTFQKVWMYPASGVTVYFTKEGTVEALMFAPGTKGPGKAAADGGEGGGPQPASARQR